MLPACLVMSDGVFLHINSSSSFSVSNIYIEQGMSVPEPSAFKMRLSLFEIFSSNLSASEMRNKQ